MKHIKKAALIILILFMVVLFVLYMLPEVYDISSFLDEYEEFDTYNLVNEKPLVYEVSKDGEQIGYLGIDSQKGYQSSIKMAVLINSDSQVINVKVVDQDETPSFFLRITNSTFFDQFQGINISDGFKINENVDSVSKATISSNAIAKAIHKSVNYVGPNYLNTQVTNLYSGINFGIVDLAIVMMLLLVLVAIKLNNKKLRTLILLYSIIILGFKFSTFVTFSSFFQIISGNFPSITENLRWYLLVIGSILLVVLSGKNIYCSYICPFGAIQEIEFKVAKLPFKASFSSKVRKRLSLLPYLLAYISLVLVLLTDNIGALSYEPFGKLFSGTGTDIKWALIFIILFSGVSILRPYCNYVCPVGLIFRALAKVKKVSVKLWTSKSEQKISY